MKCKMEGEIFEKLSEGLSIFKEKALKTLKELIKETDRVWNFCGTGWCITKVIRLQAVLPGRSSQ